MVIKLSQEFLLIFLCFEMEDKEENITGKSRKKSFLKLKESGKTVFWVWVFYQCVKGTLTTTFIWIPLIYLWWQSSH